MAHVADGLLRALVSSLPDLTTISLPDILLMLSLLLLPLLILLLLKDMSGDNVLLRKLPGPRPVYPVIGSVHLIPKHINEVLGVLVQYARQFPGLYRVRLGRDYVVLNSPEAAEAVFTSSKHIQKGEEYNGLLPWLAEGLLTSSGTKWKKRRKMLTPAFHFTIVDQFMDVFNEQAAILVSQLRDTNAQKINVFPFVTKATLDIICEATMGVQIGAQQGARSDYVAAVHRMGEIAFMRFMKPWLKSDFLFRWTSLYRSQVECLGLLHGFTDSVIRSRRAELQSSEGGTPDSLPDREAAGKKRRAFLDLLLAATVDGQPLGDSDIREEVDTFMFEGHDTTSSGINWTLYNLGLHPDVQQKAHDELHRVLGDDQGPISRGDLTRLDYLEMVIKETMRLFPPVPMIGRRLASDAVIDGHHVPGRCMAGLLIYAIHRDPRHWPDPERFDPDRFCPEACRGRHPFSYVPFSAGPRNCIGQKFALMEEKVVVASVLRSFQIRSFDKREDLKIRGDIILRLDGGLWLSFTPRH